VLVRTLVGQGSPTQLQTPVLYLHVQMKEASLYQYQIPEQYQGFVYVLSGQIKINGEELKAYEAVFLKRKHCCH
jgi:redox-sensitive bicupin YhaK (pirin superfamily)